MLLTIAVRALPCGAVRIIMSQERLAELVDLNVRNIQPIEAGEITILILCAVFGSRPLDLPNGFVSQVNFEP
jgi:hypothetical protein